MKKRPMKRVFWNIHVLGLSLQFGEDCSQFVTRCYNFFIELDLCMDPMLRSRLGVEGSRQSMSELVQAIKTDKDVLFAWSIVLLICLETTTTCFSLI